MDQTFVSKTQIHVCDVQVMQWLGIVDSVALG